MSMDNHPDNLQGLLKFMLTAQHFLRSKRGIATNQLVGNNNKNDFNNNDNLWTIMINKQHPDNY
jgi:hypothetical protein